PAAQAANAILLVRRDGVDRRNHGAGQGIRLLARMDRPGAEARLSCVLGGHAARVSTGSGVGRVALRGRSATVNRGRKIWTNGPMATAYRMVPTPNVPPSRIPATTTVTSMLVRTSRIDRPVRRTSPVIRPSRG